MSSERDELPLEIDEPLPGRAVPLAHLRKEYHSLIVSALVARGASPVEAEDLLADLWGDCVGRPDNGPSLLDKFSGKCPVQSWLLTVATHRLVDLKRRQKHRGELPGTRNAERGTRNREEPDFDQVAATSTSESEGILVELLKQCLQSAFAQCPPEAMLMLRLVYLNGLTQREVGRMWGWHEAKVSRSMSHAMSTIEKLTLRELKRRDPWLELAWADFLALCESHEIGFL